MTRAPYPLLFKQVYKDYLWGGDRLQTLFHRAVGAVASCVPPDSLLREFIGGSRYAY